MATEISVHGVTKTNKGDYLVTNVKVYSYSIFLSPQISTAELYNYVFHKQCSSYLILKLLRPNSF